MNNMTQQKTTECCEKCEYRHYDFDGYLTNDCKSEKCPCHTSNEPKSEEHIAHIECPLCGAKGTQIYRDPATIKDCFTDPQWHDCKGFKVEPPVSSDSWEQRFDEEIKIPWGNNSKFGEQLKSFISQAITQTKAEGYEQGHKEASVVYSKAIEIAKAERDGEWKEAIDRVKLSKPNTDLDQEHAVYHIMKPLLQETKDKIKEQMGY